MRFFLPSLFVHIVVFLNLAQAEEPRLEPVVQTGYQYDVERVAVSEDGKFVATASPMEGKAILWEAASGTIVRTFQMAGITSMAMSSDGRHLVTGSEDKTAILWESASGKKLQTFKGHVKASKGRIADVALSRDGKYVVTGSHDTTAMLWESASGKKLQTFKGHTSWVTSVAISSDGKLVATGSMDETAMVWEAASGKKLQTFKGHIGTVDSVALSANGRCIATADHYGRKARIWDVASGKKIQEFDHTGFGMSVALSADGRFVATRAVVTEVASGKVVQTVARHKDNVTSVAMSGNGKFLVAGGSRGTTILWDAVNTKKLQFQKKCPRELLCLALSPDGKHLVTGSTDSTATLWDLTNGKRPLPLLGHTKWIWCVAISNDGKHVVTGSNDLTAILWDKDGKKVQTFRDHPGYVMGVALTGDCKHVATASELPILWDAVSGKKIRSLDYSPQTVYSVVMCVAVSDDGTRVFTGLYSTGYDGNAILWDATKGTKLWSITDQHDDTVSSVVLSSDGKQAVTGSWDKTAVLWDLASRKRVQVFRGHTDQIRSVALSRDNKFLVSGSVDHTAILWETATGKILQTFRGHSGKVTSVAISGDGKHVWTASEDGTTRLWDPATAKERCRLYSFGNGKDWLVVTPDGFFDGSADAWQVLAYRAPGTLKLVDDDATRRRFHRPGLLAKVWNGQP